MNQDYAGFYYMMEFLMEVKQVNGDWVAAMPGVPPGYEIRLTSLGEDRFRLIGGPVDGSTSIFQRDKNGAISAIQVGDFELVKISPEKAQSLPVVERLLPPPFELTDEKRAAFDEVASGILRRSDGGWIPYTLPFPVHEFVRYLMAQDHYIFHGSGKMDIDLFQPVRTSVELHDKRGIGNLQAVYGTHDALWAMFFAVVDRSRLEGSIRNGVNYVHNRAGDVLAVYNFSINKEQLPEKPWREGALYFLPRDTFERQWLTDESPANEWASHVPVKPIARLHLKPEDFPFLDRIVGHDDSIIIRLESLARAVRAAAVAASMDDEEFTISLPESEKNRGDLEELVAIQQVMVPAASFEILSQDGKLALVVRSLPPAFRQVYSKMYADLIKP